MAVLGGKRNDDDDDNWGYLGDEVTSLKQFEASVWQSKAASLNLCGWEVKRSSQF
jgi:hypothetical protein